MTQAEADKRATAAVREMTIEEKIDLLSGGSMMGTKALPRLNIPEFRMSDGPLGAHVPAPRLELGPGQTKGALIELDPRAFHLF